MHNTTFDGLFPTLHQPLGRGQIKQQFSDFIVTEHNAVDWTEQGEHLWVRLEKTNSNTAWAATQLARACKVPARQVGYAGLKDRHAVTRQWFSVQLPKMSDPDSLNERLPDELTILESHWHRSKLKTGFLTHNHFTILIRGLQASDAQVTERLQWLRQQGVPNYFGPQRFGHDMNNIRQAELWFNNDIRVNNRNKRSLYLSAARSYLFNLMVAERIRNHCWAQPLAGDVLQLDGSHSWFLDSAADADNIRQRLEDFDIHLTAALCGEGPLPSQQACAALEQQVMDQHPRLLAGLCQHRLKQDRRAIRLPVSEIQHRWLEDNLELSFALPAGGFATCVLRELCQLEDCGSAD